MKPTQQEIIELAREAGFGMSPNMSAIRINGYADDLLRLATLLLERFGAGGGEPVAWLDRNGFPHHISHLQPLRDMKNGKWSPLYKHPSPTDLRGLEDAAKVCESLANPLQVKYSFAVALECAKEIRALKGKQ